MGRVRARRAVVLFAFASLALVACGGDEVGQPALSGPDVHRLWIDGYYFHSPSGSLMIRNEGAIVFVREGSEGGRVVSEASLAINGTPLSYDESMQAYVGTGLGISSGDSLRLAVGSGGDTVSAMTVVPYAPSDLFLRSVTWNVSAPGIGNTLRWNNPSVLGEKLVVYLYTPVDGEEYLLWTGGTDHPESDFLTVYNHELPYASTLTSITGLVCQANDSLFAANPGHSAFTVLAGVRGTWETSR